MLTSDRIEILRKRQGISLTHLNTAIGAYRGKITDVRAGKASFSNEEIEILAKELNTSTDYLLGNTDDPTPAGANTTDTPVPFQLTKKAREMLDIFLSLDETTQDGLLDYAKYLASHKSDAPMPAETHLA